MKIGIFQDVHANLPAFKKAIEIFEAYNCSKIYHVGDLIGIGPHPKEVFEYALSISNLEFIMGNHDYWYGFGLPKPKPKWMSAEEFEHQNWVHQQIGPAHRSVVQHWKFVEKLNLVGNRSITFQHYGYDEQTNWFKGHILKPSAADLDEMFDGNTSAILFYGHNHLVSDITGKFRYVNLGSAGCFDKAEVRLGILEISEDKLALEKLSIPYEDDGLMEAFEEREVPARAFITQNFIKRK